jgi:hypothetical protein
MTGSTKEYNLKWRQNKREEADKVFGTKCSICNSKINLCLHEKSGKIHNTSCTASIALKNPKEWVRLCYPCHKAVHWVMTHFKMSWNEIVARLR